MWRLMFRRVLVTAKGTSPRDSKVVLYCTVLYCTVLYCVVLYCIVLYCVVDRHFPHAKHLFVFPSEESFQRKQLNI